VNTLQYFSTTSNLNSNYYYYYYYYILLPERTLSRAAQNGHIEENANCRLRRLFSTMSELLVSYHWSDFVTTTVCLSFHDQLMFFVNHLLFLFITAGQVGFSDLGLFCNDCDQRWVVVRSAKRCRHCILGLLDSAYLRLESQNLTCTPVQCILYTEHCVKFWG
jgi:hypothetical protein